MFTSFLIKYAEIGIKGKNRYLFEDALVRQIKYALKKCEGEFLVHKTQGRIFVDAESEFDYDEVVAHLQRVFGISGICPVVHVQDEGFEKLCETVIDYFLHHERVFSGSKSNKNPLHAAGGIAGNVSGNSGKYFPCGKNGMIIPRYANIG